MYNRNALNEWHELQTHNMSNGEGKLESWGSSVGNSIFLYIYRINSVCWSKEVKEEK